MADALYCLCMQELIRITLVISLISAIAAYNTTAPVWITSPLFRAGDKRVIDFNLTGSGTNPRYVFTYSSSLTGVPNLAYGIKAYRGSFSYIQETTTSVNNFFKSEKYATIHPVSRWKCRYTG